MSLRAAWCLALLACLLLSACTVHVFSPPHGAPLVESSATIGKGRHSVRGDIQGGEGWDGPPLRSYRVSVARGITERLDVSLAPSLMWLRAPEAGNPHGAIYSLRVGMKYAPVRYVALSYGLAPGGSAGGSYLAHDAGITLGGENPYLVPFVGFHGLLSAPLKARTVRISYTDDDENEPPEERGPDVYFRKPRFTTGWQLLLGLKVPLRHDSASKPSALPLHKVLPSFACAVGFTALASKGSKERSERVGDLYGTFGCALDATF